MAASEYGDLLAVMDAQKWSYADALHAYETMPEPMWHEMIVRLSAKGRAADDKRRENDALNRVRRSHGRR